MSGGEGKSQPLPPSLRFRLHCISAQQVGAKRQRFPLLDFNAKAQSRGDAKERGVDAA
jgi:hypothetical protein